MLNNLLNQGEINAAKTAPMCIYFVDRLYYIQLYSPLLVEKSKSIKKENQDSL